MTEQVSVSLSASEMRQLQKFTLFINNNLAKDMDRLFAFEKFDQEF